MSAAEVAKQLVAQEAAARQQRRPPNGSTATAAPSASRGGIESAGGMPLTSPYDAGLTPAALRSTLLRALSILRWMEVYTYYANESQLAHRTRIALSHLATCTDLLYDACKYGAAPGTPPDWTYLSSAAGAMCRSWLVTCIHSLTTHVQPGPPEQAKRLRPVPVPAPVPAPVPVPVPVPTHAHPSRNYQSCEKVSSHNRSSPRGSHIKVPCTHDILKTCIPQTRICLGLTVGLPATTTRGSAA